ncbi:PEP-CTERM sorting domain-containing protein [Coraliomargarita algicola]|uniref:PEP-CTERM sorting domain-containing protein n=1 Tax=Coraliomargarita algicola TaxID=3092156 RepID=A0ABZ0RGD1_9BACT|nr:PEP-CTERM sorting domain-containing protein [Coraliomargarita sp. J2-16]WPJ94617.1 PEP-CTERM sorting domain-containing protein [Coraliomargarita sp. J2-16]
MKVTKSQSRALKKTALIIAFLGSSINASNASMYLAISYDGLNTIIQASGSWDSFELNTTVEGYENGFMNPQLIEHFGGEFDWSSGGLTLSDGNALPQFGFTFDTNGDAFGFNQYNVAAPVGYTAGDNINATIIVEGDVFGITSNPNQGGTYSNESNSLTWATVPEPSSFAMITGLASIAAIVRRRRHRG